MFLILFLIFPGLGELPLPTPPAQKEYMLDNYLRLEINKRRAAPNRPSSRANSTEEEIWPLKGQPEDEQDPLMHIMVIS